MLSEIKKLTGLPVLQERADGTLTHFASIDEVDASAVIFIEDIKHAESLQGKPVGLIITPEQLSHPSMQIVCEKPRQVFFSLVAHFSARALVPGIHPTAVVGNGVTIDLSAQIDAYAVLSDNVTVGAGTFIGAHTVLGESVHIGAETVIYPLVSIYHDVTIGDRCCIHSGAVIGADGYGFAEISEKLIKIPQIGRIEIGDEVEIGANTCIDRATLGKTLIENGVKIDNLVQIAHNVRIREHARIVSQVGIAGSTEIGRWVILAGQAGLADHITIADKVIVTAQAGIGKSLTEPGVYSGTPARPMREHYKILAYESKLDEMWQKLKLIEQKMKLYEENNSAKS